MCATLKPILRELPSPWRRQVDLEMHGLAEWQRTSRSIFNVKAAAAPHICIIYSSFWVQMDLNRAVHPDYRGIRSRTKPFRLSSPSKWGQFKGQYLTLSLLPPLHNTERNTSGRSLKFVSSYTDFLSLRAHNAVCISERN